MSTCRVQFVLKNGTSVKTFRDFGWLNCSNMYSQLDVSEAVRLCFRRASSSSPTCIIKVIIKQQNSAKQRWKEHKQTKVGHQEIIAAHFADGPLVRAGFVLMDLFPTSQIITTYTPVLCICRNICFLCFALILSLPLQSAKT